MKYFVMILMSSVLLVSCRRDSKHEQKITIKIDTPEDVSHESSAPAEDAPMPDDENASHLLKKLVDQLEEVKPIHQAIMKDAECRRLADKGDAHKFAQYLMKEHAGSISEIAAKMGAKDLKTVAWATARNLIRKAERERSGPGTQKKRPRSQQ